uniref:Uncharacterized protein n=1 Tax=viral metagenome TaxID=1070528 RepID=A0A6C0JPD2_9ZZZZ
MDDTHINIDELYEHKKKNDLNRLDIYNKLLIKIHSKIKVASRLRNSDNFCSYIMPEVLIGYPNYNLSDCLVFIVGRLQNDGFLTRYIHPNLLFISWNHWIPSYVRDEYKKKTGIAINCYGEPIHKEKNVVKFDTKESKTMNIKSQSKFVYDDELFSSIKEKL